MMPSEADLLGVEDRSSWCGDTDPTGRYVCQRIRDHALDWHAARNSEGGVHQWPAACPAEVVPAIPVDCPVGTVLVDPETGRWAVRFTRGDDTGKGQHVWLSPAGVVHAQTRFLHHTDVRGWEVAEARRWGRVADPDPPANTDLRARCIAALNGMPSEFISPDEFGGYDIHNAELVDIVLAEVQPELDRLAAIATAARYFVQPEGCKDMACDHDDDVCVRMETRFATADDAIAAAKVPWLEAERERLLGICAKYGDFTLAVAEALGLPASTSNDDLIAAAAQLTRELGEAQAELAERPTVWAYEQANRALEKRRVTLVTALGGSRQGQGYYDAIVDVENLVDDRATLSSMLRGMARRAGALRRGQNRRSCELGEAQAEVESFCAATRRLASLLWLDPEDHQALDVLGRITEQLAAWRSDATQIPEGWQSLVRKGWGVGASRLAIPADAEQQLFHSLRHVYHAVDHGMDFDCAAEARELLARWLAPVSGSDTTASPVRSTPTVEHWITEDGHRLREHQGKLWYWGHPDSSGNMAWFEEAFPDLDAVRRQGHTLTLVPARAGGDTTEVPGER